MVNRILLCLPVQLHGAIENLMNGEVARCLSKGATVKSNETDQVMDAEILDRHVQTARLVHVRPAADPQSVAGRMCALPEELQTLLDEYGGS